MQMVNPAEALGEALEYFLSTAEEIEKDHLRIYGDDRHFVHVGKSIRLRDARAHLPDGHTANLRDTYELHRFSLRDLKPEIASEVIPHGRDYRLDGAPILEAGVIISGRDVVTLDKGLLKAYDYKMRGGFPYYELDYVIEPGKGQAHLARLTRTIRSDGTLFRYHGAVPNRINWVQTLAAIFRGNINPQGLLVGIAG